MRMSTRCAGLLLTIGISAACTAYAQGRSSVAKAAAKIAGCGAPDQGGDPDLEAWAGSPDPQLRILVRLLGDPDDSGLGSLCVAVLRQEGGRFVPVATLSEDDQPSPPADVDPITFTSVNVEGTSFRFMPNEVAVAVSASGGMDSQSTAAGSTTLYLFRRLSGRLHLIFQAETQSTETDKTRGKTTAEQWVIRFTSSMHNGAYDLIRTRDHGHGRDIKRYVWSGKRYIAMAGRH